MRLKNDRSRRAVILKSLILPTIGGLIILGADRLTAPRLAPESKADSDVRRNSVEAIGSNVIAEANRSEGYCTMRVRLSNVGLATTSITGATSSPAFYQRPPRFQSRVAAICSSKRTSQ